ncbi:VRR-NUC domain-containing protein [Falseniella ignava]|nr:VRR-NUC domain-containing protein [Falseniella ignava]
MNKETALMNRLRVKASEYGVCFRANVGKVRMADGRFFDTGLPRGFSDLFGVRNEDGKAFFIEVKTEKGRPSKEQLNFIEQMNKRGALAGICRNEKDVEELLNGNF